MELSKRVALLSDDLLFRSQLDAAVRGSGGELVTTRVGGPTPEVDAVFVDLNSDSAHRLGFIASARAERPGLTIIAFCHHEERELRQAAMHVGASSCVTNGALQSVALRLAGVFAPPGQRA